MKISRRKYSVLVKFLREIITSSKSERIRYAAAERLDGIYARHEMYEQQALRRKERSEARVLAQQGQGSPVAPQEPTSQDEQEDSEEQETERISSVFANILSKSKGRADADTTE